mmetsp:Transcript_53754/g.116161  ORF Transcript_53754/g.116161 Transcript_53754/m.116161 type:complete len:230 (+) Transcript_53754:615-1304(+)
MRLKPRKSPEPVARISAGTPGHGSALALPRPRAHWTLCSPSRVACRPEAPYPVSPSSSQPPASRRGGAHVWRGTQPLAAGAPLEPSSCVSPMPHGQPGRRSRHSPGAVAPPPAGAAARSLPSGGALCASPSQQLSFAREPFPPLPVASPAPPCWPQLAGSRPPGECSDGDFDAPRWSASSPAGLSQAAPAASRQHPARGTAGPSATSASPGGWPHPARPPRLSVDPCRA